MHADFVEVMFVWEEKYQNGYRLDLYSSLSDRTYQNVSNLCECILRVQARQHRCVLYSNGILIIGICVFSFN
jgi:hypothetical protein